MGRMNPTSGNTTSLLLDAWKAARGIKTDTAAAQVLGLSGPSAVSNWRNGRSHAAPAIAARMAKEAGWPELETLAAIEADRTKGEDSRTWRRLARHLGPAVVVAAVALLISDHPGAAALAGFPGLPIMSIGAAVTLAAAWWLARPRYAP